MASDRPADIAPGHKRDEARRVVADQLAEQIERNEADSTIEALDESKLHQRDNEIARHVENGSVPIEGAQRGRHYIWITVAEGYNQAARANIRMMHTIAKKNGYEPVSGDMPEAQEFKGNDCAAGTSLRGVGDTILYWCTEDNYQRMLRDAERRLERQQAVEQNSVVYAQQELGRAGMANTMHGAAGDFRSDPVMHRAFGAAGQPITYTATPEEQEALRRGTMRVGGQVVQPGFERRR